MNDQDFELVQENYPSFVDAVALRYQYFDAALAKIKATSTQVLGNEPASVSSSYWRTDDARALQVRPSRDREHCVVLLLCPDGKFRIQFYVQENRRRPDANRSAFTDDGRFTDWGDEHKGRTWVFAKRPDEESFASALETFRLALSLLRDKTR